MKLQLSLALVVFGLLSLSPSFAQSAATVEHAGNHDGDAFRVGEVIKITFTTTPSWRDSKMAGIAINFVPVSIETPSQGFQVNCGQQDISFLPDGKVSCKGTIAGAGIFAGSYKVKQINFAPDGLIAHWAPMTSSAIRVGAPGPELQKRLDGTTFGDASVSH